MMIGDCAHDFIGENFILGEILEWRKEVNAMIGCSRDNRNNDGSKKKDISCVWLLGAPFCWGETKGWSWDPSLNIRVKCFSETDVRSKNVVVVLRSAGGWAGCIILLRSLPTDSAVPHQPALQSQAVLTTKKMQSPQQSNDEKNALFDLSSSVVGQ